MHCMQDQLQHKEHCKQWFITQSQGCSNSEHNKQHNPCPPPPVYEKELDNEQMISGLNRYGSTS